MQKKILEQIYEKYSQGDFAGLLALCDDSVTFQVPGKSRFAGKFTKANVVGSLFAPMREMGARLEVHDILASERHGVVLGTGHIEHQGKKIELRKVHVWRFENAKPVAWYEYPRDLYVFDQIFS